MNSTSILTSAILEARPVPANQPVATGLYTPSSSSEEFQVRSVISIPSSIPLEGSESHFDEDFVLPNFWDEPELTRYQFVYESSDDEAAPGEIVTDDPEGGYDFSATSMSSIVDDDYEAEIERKYPEHSRSTASRSSIQQDSTLELPPADLRITADKSHATSDLSLVTPNSTPAAESAVPTGEPKELSKIERYALTLKNQGPDWNYYIDVVRRKHEEAEVCDVAMSSLKEGLRLIARHGKIFLDARRGQRYCDYKAITVLGEAGEAGCQEARAVQAWLFATGRVLELDRESVWESCLMNRTLRFSFYGEPYSIEEKVLLSLCIWHDVRQQNPKIIAINRDYGYKTLLDQMERGNVFACYYLAWLIDDEKNLPHLDAEKRGEMKAKVLKRAVEIRTPKLV